MADASALLRASLDRRVARLVKLMALQAPAVIVCAAIVLVVKAAILVYGEVFWGALHHEVEGSLRNAVGLCAGCDSEHRPMEFCDSCLRRAGEELGDDSIN